MVTTPQSFTPSDWQRVMTLPRQTGLWMAALDAGGGDTAWQAEEAEIDAFLRTARHKFENIPFIVQVIDAAWAVSFVPPFVEADFFAEAAQAIACLEAIASRIEVNAYRLLLIEMAEHVARAAPDRDEAPQNLYGGPQEGWHGLYPFLADALVRTGRGPQVSGTEKEGINRLIDVLNAGDMVEKWDIVPDAQGRKRA